MKAFVKLKPEPGIWMTDVPQPIPQQDEVLIKIKKTAICGTDKHIFQWNSWAAEHVPTPLIIGHEFVGEVVEIGENVKELKLGDRVSGEGHIACGHCQPCRSRYAHLCSRNESVGVTRNGCFAEYIVIPAIYAYPIPATIPDTIASILDPFGNAVHTALSFDLVDKNVLITGAGPVGLMAALITQRVGARQVVITENNAYRLNLAKKIGVTHAIHPATLPTLMETLGVKEGFDVGLEMSGNASAFQEMLTVMGHGGKIAMLGFLPTNTAVNWNLIIMRGLILKGIYGREIFETWRKAIDLLQNGLDLSPVITHEFSIDHYQDAFSTIASGQCGKIILNWV